MTSARVLTERNVAPGRIFPWRWSVPASGWQNAPRESAVLKGKHIEVIANPIDPCEFKPLAKEEARRAFNLPQDKKLGLFGAVGGTADARKGFVYLQEALRTYRRRQRCGTGRLWGGKRRIDKC